MFNSSSLSDEEIVDIVRSKDQEMYREIVKRYQFKLRRYARSLVRDEHKAADLVQEAFIKAFINLQGFNKRLKFSSWIYRIVHNEAVNLLRKSGREVFFPADFDFDSGVDLEIDWQNQETKEKVKKCLTEIPLIYAEVLSLFFLEDKSYNEISDILRLSIGTVGTRINRGKIIMKKICQEKKT